MKIDRYGGSLLGGQAEITDRLEGRKVVNFNFFDVNKELTVKLFNICLNVLNSESEDQTDTSEFQEKVSRVPSLILVFDSLGSPLALFERPNNAEDDEKLENAINEKWPHCSMIDINDLYTLTVNAQDVVQSMRWR